MKRTRTLEAAAALAVCLCMCLGIAGAIADPPETAPTDRAKQAGPEGERASVVPAAVWSGGAVPPGRSEGEDPNAECGDGACDGGEDCATCPEDCGACQACGDPDAGDCCEENGTPFCNDLECCESVCLTDPFCCDGVWDSLCADAAAENPLCPCGAGCEDAMILIRIMTDDYGSETTWELVDHDLGVVASGGPYGNATLYEIAVCVDSTSCHDWTIYDAYGDGICCAWGIGWYEILFNGELVAEGGQFGDSETVSCIGGCTGGGCCRGDMNGDEVVDMGDIGPFAAALLNPPAPEDPMFCHIDANGDDVLDGLDIEAFVSVLVEQIPCGGGCGDGTCCSNEDCMICPLDCGVCAYCEPCYSDCDPSVPGSPDDWITNVTFNSIDNTTGPEGCPCSYGDYSDIVTGVWPNSTYTLTVTFYSEEAWTECVKAWFDWNKNELLEDSESYFLGCALDTEGPLMLDITVPGDAEPGCTKMRVIEQYFTEPMDPCVEHDYGEAEDYTVCIVNPGDCGNGQCQPGEDCTTCPADCGECYCGDGTCHEGEDCANCPDDCGECPSCGHPDTGDCCEDNGTPFCDDPTCCESVCSGDPFCCGDLGGTWDGLCAAAACEDPNCQCCGNCPDAVVLIRILTDNYGGETTWELLEQGGGQVAAGGPYDDATLYEVYVCVDSTGCYDWIIYDAYGDGICGEFGIGWYEVYYNEVLQCTGCEFLDQDICPNIGDGCP